jgi:hypothetical protein
MNKKFLIASIIVLAVILVAGLLAYKYIGLAPKVENSLGGAEIESPAQEQTISTPQTSTQSGTQNVGSLTICVDKCGDGACQVADTECGKNDNNLNCICPESPQDCPEDCK